MLNLPILSVFGLILPLHPLQNLLVIIVYFRFLAPGTIIAMFMGNYKIQGKELIMLENNMEYRSLCSNCRNTADCTFQKDRQKPALYCEEFEIDISPSAKIAGKEKPLPTASVDVEDDDSDKFIGLCSNCDNRRKCVFPMPEGGVWHCEEYR